MTKTYFYLNQTTNDDIWNPFTAFQPFPDEIGLPFPLNLSLIWRSVLIVSLLLALIQGTRLRMIIISYLNAPETNLGPINYLVWIDQVNGGFLAYSILIRIIILISPVPLHSIFGAKFCLWNDFASAVYISGSFTWNFCIAVFRVLFIRSQNWLKNAIGVKNLLNVFILVGLLEVLTFSIVYVVHDQDGSLKKTCSHLSNQDLEILNSYQVKNFFQTLRNS